MTRTTNTRFFAKATATYTHFNTN